MYGIEVVTPPAADPVTAAELRARLRLFDAAEDTILTELIESAVDLWENDTGRPVLATTYRQYLSRWPFGPFNSPAPAPAPGWGWEPAISGIIREWYPGQIVLGRGGVTAVAGVKRYLSDGTTTEDVTNWVADLHTPPNRISLQAVPDPVLTAAGVPVSPVGYVEFTAGWADAASVPRLVRTALMLLAGHWYKNREAHQEQDLKELPDGWCRVVNRYRTGLIGDWGQ